MVSTKLVDGRTTPAWNGWSLSLVEVHQNRLAPRRSPSPPAERGSGGEDGFLLREAVQRTEPPDEIHGMDPDDGAVGKHLGEDA